MNQEHEIVLYQVEDTNIYVNVQQIIFPCI